MRGPIDTGLFESKAEFEKQKRENSTFWPVVETYSNIRQRHPLAAINLDPFAPPTKLTFDLVDYLADVELATWHVLTPALYGLWQRLIEGEKIPAASERVIIARCSRIYGSRGLLPVTYFRRIKQGRKCRQPETAA
jgi:hypothetical protein